MWDFEIGRTLSIMARTWPFIALRIVIYFAITVAYMFAIGAGAGIGFGVGQIAERPEGFALVGGIAGFGLASLIVYWIREYMLYVVKAGHIAVMVHLIDGRPVPGGKGQIAYARQVVADRFMEANVLFVLDQLIKGAIRVITGLVGGVAQFLPIPGLQTLVAFFNSVVRLSLTYVDEIILGYNIRTGSTTPFDTARHGVVLYAQNATRMIKNAVWLALFTWILALGVVILMLAPAGAILYAMPGQLTGWSFAVAVILAWAVWAALIEPFAVCALMQAYFRTIEGQTPDPEWDRKLSDASKHFRQIKERAGTAFGGRPTNPANG